jgi:MYXO-CTERM domain-containing protein
MDSTMVRVVCAGLALLLGGVIVMRRRRRNTE